MMKPAYWIAGTDTGVGKTVITGLLAHMFLSAGHPVTVYKPVQTGSPSLDEAEDPTSIQTWLSEDVLAGRLRCENRYNFLIPATPAVVDTDCVIDPAQILNDIAGYQYSNDMDGSGVLLVEGAGGLRVPITPNLEQLELIRESTLPVILVTRPDLGTINHTLLSVEALQRRQIPVVGVIVSGYQAVDVATETLPEMFERFLPVPVLAWVPKLALQCDHPFQNVLSEPWSAGLRPLL
ncbi:MAG: dethiobiotin synthase [Cyanobacteria bacterium]|nr:dethiobiotin synthase [Cyanobacteriota bacterium]